MPVETKTGAVPSDDGLGFDDNEDVCPARPKVLQRGPEQPVKGGQRWPRSFALEHGDLLSEGKNFEGSITSTPEEDADGGQDCEDEFGHELTVVTWRNVAPWHGWRQAPKLLIKRQRTVLSTHRGYFQGLFMRSQGPAVPCQSLAVQRKPEA